MHKRDFGTWVRCEICGERRLHNSVGERLKDECEHSDAVHTMTLTEQGKKTIRELIETPLEIHDTQQNAHLQELARLVDQRIAAALEVLANRYPGNHGFGEVVKILAQDLRR